MLNAAERLSKVRPTVVSIGFMDEVVISNPEDSNLREVMVKDWSRSKCEWRKGKGGEVVYTDVFFKRSDFKWEEEMKVITDGGWRQEDCGSGLLTELLIAVHISWWVKAMRNQSGVSLPVFGYLPKRDQPCFKRLPVVCSFYYEYCLIFV